ncbi:MAG: hypothetical protein DSY50_04210 [Desulfobulbus sp.]|nr:MAG: hypothetical protein DSY50_04210 [Desulfobulbus sp.]RUM36835.1 MAG: hypothetical protein DSY58_04790 [Desulfobulbus sp.]
MKKTLLTLAAAACLLMAASTTQAATAKCKVTDIKDNVVTLDCGKTAAKIVAGDVVKVKTARKKAIEGC